MANNAHNPLKYSPEHTRQPARPYQKAAVRKVFDNLDPDEPILVHVATGGGKTRIGNDVVVKLLRNLDQEDWILWIAPNWELLMQAATDLVRRNRGFEEKIARLGGGKNAMPGVSGDFEDINSANVIFTTTDTYLSRAKRGELRGWQPHPSLIIWDECHKGEKDRKSVV